MKTRLKLMTGYAIAQVLLLGPGWGAGAGITVGPEAAGAVSWSSDGRTVPLSGEGGFRIYDATARKEIVIGRGTLTSSGGKTTFASDGPDVRLHAEFVPQGDFVMVRGEVENRRGDERGLMVDYRLPRLSPGAYFSNALEQSVRMAGAAEQEGNVFPIAAMCDQATGIALAIPPAEPRAFGLVADDRGMTLRFYLGLSPKPKRFPNRASFVFVIYGVEPKWGFRSALSRYYGFFPDYYTPRLKRDGLFMFQMADRVPANIDHYGFNEIEPQWDGRTLTAAITRDQQHGISTFPYTIVGQREIKFLPALPRNYAAAVAILARWTVADHAGHALTKENVASEGDIRLKEEVESSACQGSDGRYALVLRETPWGGNSISFKINPNPDLFADEHRPTVGGDTLALAQRWLKEHPEYAGIYVDSLGANWPAVLNYRPDHFTYARYPLTFDSQGRVALQNDVSHYEYIESLRAKMRTEGLLVLGNGIYAYKSRGEPAPRLERQTIDKQLTEFTAASAPPEHYRAGTKLGRFFCAALLDLASSEAGVSATVERCREVRSFMGRKQYAFLNYHWENGAQIEALINKSLCYGIFASSSTNFMTGVQYENHPNGYLRDKQLLDWYVPLVRQLSRAGWEPVRHATVEGEGVACERFGRGDTVYYALYNDSAAAKTGTLQVDLAALGLASGSARWVEIARHTEVSPKAGRVTFELASKRAYVIQITKDENPLR